MSQSTSRPFKARNGRPFLFRRLATIEGGVAAVVKRRYATRVIRGRLGAGLERPQLQSEAPVRGV